MTQVYKIATGEDWEAACRRGTYAGSADDLRDGFIHFSTAGQLPGTLEKHFAGRDDLVLIAFDAADLGGALKWEPSRGGELFPHLYAALDTTLAHAVMKLAVDDSGRHVLPEEIGE
ncbi:MAG: hypothetical protein RLZ98_60 [Pseudomonadota bacterium]|jgi:uncharacterized protein (DUF952 family)